MPGAGAASLITSSQVTWRVELALESGAAGASVWDTATWQGSEAGSSELIPDGTTWLGADGRTYTSHGSAMELALGDGDGIWSGEEPSWIDASQFALQASWNRGKDRWDQRVRTGALVVDFDNTEGQFNPEFGGTLPGQTSLRPGRLMRLSVDAGQGYVPVSTGTIDSITDTYRDGAFDIITRVQAFDAFGLWAIINPPAVPVVPAELSSERLDRMLDLVGHASSKRALQAGLNVVQASDLPRAYLDEMGIASDSEGGLFFIDGDNVAVSQNRDYQITSPRATVPQYSVGDTADENALLAANSDWTLQRIQNDVRLARAGGTEQRIQDTTSAGLYGQRTFSRFDYENEFDADVLALAQKRVDNNAWDAVRIDEVTIDATTQQAAQLLIGTELTDRIRVVLNVRGGEWGYAQDVLVTRIRGQVSAEDFTFTFRVDDAVPRAPDDVGSFQRDAFSDGFY